MDYINKEQEEWEAMEAIDVEAKDMNRKDKKVKDMRQVFLRA